MTTLPLQDRTLVLAGPVTRSFQMMARELAQAGAHVALLETGGKDSEFLATQIMDMREVNERFGRAMALPLKATDKGSLSEAVSRVAETFGSVEGLIDFQMPMKKATGATDIDSLVSEQLAATLHLTEQILPFLKARKRGRIIYMYQTLLQKGLQETALHHATRSGLIGYAHALSYAMQEYRVTVNSVGIGATEEFITQFAEPGETVDAAKQRLRGTWGFQNLTEADKVAQVLIFLLGAQGGAITGQDIKVE